MDASQYGLGACIMQDGVPVAYASRTLTDTHKRYAQVEKEMMAIEFGLHRFHQYIYGQTVTVETDHLPLLGVMRKPIADISPRLQRMRLKCLYYDFQLVYKPGRELIIADTLSRTQLAEQYITDNHEVERVIELTELIIPTELQRQNIKALTKSDVTLQALVTVLQTEWPASRKLCPDSIKPFWNEKDNLIEYDGLIFKGQQLVIPTALRPTIMKEVHSGHFGIVKLSRDGKSSSVLAGVHPTDQGHGRIMFIVPGAQTSELEHAASATSCSRSPLSSRGNRSVRTGWASVFAECRLLQQVGVCRSTAGDQKHRCDSCTGKAIR